MCAFAGGCCLAGGGSTGRRIGDVPTTQPTDSFQFRSCFMESILSYLQTSDYSEEAFILLFHPSHYSF